MSESSTAVAALARSGSLDVASNGRRRVKGIDQADRKVNKVIYRWDRAKSPGWYWYLAAKVAELREL